MNEKEAEVMFGRRSRQWRTAKQSSFIKGESSYFKMGKKALQREKCWKTSSARTTPAKSQWLPSVLVWYGGSWYGCWWCCSVVTRDHMVELDKPRRWEDDPQPLDCFPSAPHPTWSRFLNCGIRPFRIPIPIGEGTAVALRVFKDVHLVYEDPELSFLSSTTLRSVQSSVCAYIHAWIFA